VIKNKWHFCVFGVDQVKNSRRPVRNPPTTGGTITRDRAMKSCSNVRRRVRSAPTLQVSSPVTRVSTHIYDNIPVYLPSPVVVTPLASTAQGSPLYQPLLYIKSARRRRHYNNIILYIIQSYSVMIRLRWIYILSVCRV